MNTKMDLLKPLVDVLMKILSDISNEGKNKLVTILTETLHVYIKPTQYTVQGYIYQRTRTRSNDINNSIKNVQLAGTDLEQLQQIQAIFNAGNWNFESYNTRLFFRLIQETNVYNLPSSSVIHAEIIPCLLHALILRIQTLEKTTNFESLSIKERKNEIKKIQDTKKKPAPVVTILDDLPNAINLACNNPDQTVFYLCLTSRGWHLNWLDPYGKKHVLPVESELASLLKNIKVYNNITLVQQQKIQNQCMRVRDNFLERMTVLINPSDDLPNIVNVFLLSHQQTAFSLVWYDRTGHKKDINLTNYPPLFTFLSQVTEWTAESTKQLSTYLPSVNTRSVLTVQDNFKNQLAKCLGHKAPVVKESKLAVNPQELSINKSVLSAESFFTKKVENRQVPGRIDVSKFNHLAVLFAEGNRF